MTTCTLPPASMSRSIDSLEMMFIITYHILLVELSMGEPKTMARGKCSLLPSALVLNSHIP